MKKPSQIRNYMSNKQLTLSIVSELDIETKTCIYCNIEKTIDEFPKHIHYKDNLDSRCKICIKKHSDIVKNIRKHAPDKPETCECCKQVPAKWCLDHDHTTETFRGWLCDKCNTGIGKLGDNVDGIVNALNYLLSRK